MVELCEGRKLAAPPKAQRATSRARKTTPLSKSPMRTRLPTRTGWASDCLRRPNGSLQRGAGWPARLTRGGRIQARGEVSWPTPTRDNFPSRHRRRWLRGPRASEILSTQRYGLYDMSGNGAATGIDPTTLSNSRQPAASHATRKVRRARLIPPSPACANACKRAVHFSALTSIAHATSSERAARASRAQH